MKLTLTFGDIDIVDPDYQFTVKGVNKKIISDLQERLRELGIEGSITPIYPNRKEYSYAELMRLSGLDPQEDAVRVGCIRKIKTLFEIIDLKIDRFENNGKLYLTDDEVELWVEFIKDDQATYVLSKTIRKEKTRPEDIKRRDTKKQKEDYEEYEEWLEARNKLTSYIRMLWIMCSNRGYLEEKEIKQKFMLLPFDMNSKIEQYRLQLRKEIDNFFVNCIDDSVYELAVFDREKMIEYMFNKTQDLISSFMELYMEAKIIQKDNSIIAEEHSADKSPLIDMALQRVFVQDK